MGIFDTITRPFAKRRLRKEQLEELNSTLWSIVADGVVTDAELGELNKFFYDSELSLEEIQKSQADVFTQLVHQAIADRRVTPEEFRSLEHIAERFSVSSEQLVWMRQQIQYFRMLNEIESGADLPALRPSGLILQKDERCHVSVPAFLYEERVVRSTYQGGSRGVSIRVMKGVSYRVGAHRGHIQSERAVVPVTPGTFNVTNKRLIFSGTLKSNSTAYPKLLDLQLYSDGLQYSVTSRQKPIILGFPTPEHAELCGLVISRVLNS